MNDILRRAVPPLLIWYEKNKRDLPWRHTSDPYRVLVSELMLQQTRVEAVKEAYVAFLEKFPTAEALADSSEDEVLKAWEGLGYYSRARNLHKAAKTIAAEGFPKTYEGVRSLSGVGDYTAGAILSIAYNLPYPAVDGNVVRVLSRLLCDSRSADGDGLKKEYASLLKEVYPKEASSFCQALMEIGALICLPNGAPSCGACPWNGLCLAHKQGIEEELPVKSEKRPRKVCREFVYVLKFGEEYALEKRGEKGLLAGMWQFPLREKETGFAGVVLAEKKAKHIFTHVEWDMAGKLIAVEEKDEKFVWATREEIGKFYAIPSAFKAFLEWI